MKPTTTTAELAFCCQQAAERIASLDLEQRSGWISFILELLDDDEDGEILIQAVQQACKERLELGGW